MRTGEWKSTSMTCVDVGRREVGDARALRDRGVVHERVEPAERVPRFERDLLGARRDRRGRRPTSASRGRAGGSGRAPPRSRSARRATMPTVAPRSARIGASAAPMPDEAPVTRIFAPSSFTCCAPSTRARPTRRCPSTSSRLPPRPASPNTSARTACTALSSGAACAASSARWPASRRSPAAASSARAVGEACARRRRASASSCASAAAGAGFEVRRVAVVPAAVVAPDVAHDELGLVVDRPQVRTRRAGAPARARVCTMSSRRAPWFIIASVWSSKRLQQLGAVVRALGARDRRRRSAARVRAAAPRVAARPSRGTPSAQSRA